MDLVSLTVGLPFAPLRGLLALARLLEEEAERELYDPSRVQRQIDAIDQARERGELSDVDAEQAEQEVLNRVLHRAAEE